MKKDFIENFIINRTRQVMTDSIDNTDDVNFLKSELKKQLRENWNSQENKEHFIKYLEDKIKECDKCIESLNIDLNFNQSKNMNYVGNIQYKLFENQITKENYQDILERIKNNNYD